jgi:hypothetical protein
VNVEEEKLFLSTPLASVDFFCSKFAAKRVTTREIFLTLYHAITYHKKSFVGFSALEELLKLSARNNFCSERRLIDAQLREISWRTRSARERALC